MALAIVGRLSPRVRVFGKRAQNEEELAEPDWLDSSQTRWERRKASFFRMRSFPQVREPQPPLPLEFADHHPPDLVRVLAYCDLGLDNRESSRRTGTARHGPLTATAAWAT